MRKKKLRILISVSDKSSLVGFVKKLANIFALEIISTGGTAEHLKQAGIKVIKVEELTKFPEILSGRVKTLHPAVFGGILADKSNSAHLKQLKKYLLKTFDMVVVNLYPFIKTVKNSHTSLNEAVEQIDIGGVALLRAGAKNFSSIIVVCQPKDYDKVTKNLKNNHGLSLEQKKELAVKAFKLTSEYDQAIWRYLSSRVLK